jgi:hypothetical protein
MKNIIFIALLCILATSCAHEKGFIINGEVVTVEPYGWANKEAKYNDSIVYEVSAGNVFWSIVGVETIVIPVYLTGWELFEPVKIKK